MEWEGRVVSAHHKLAATERLLSAKKGKPDEWKRYDGEFHQALISNCGSRALVEAHVSVFDKYFRTRCSRSTTAARSLHASINNCWNLPSSAMPREQRP
jgi:DNA-binding GntR family transcriptional regulator